MNREHGTLYAGAGVDYESIDEMKRYAQVVAPETATDSNFEKYGIVEIGNSRGLSGYVMDIGPFHDAITVEGLGTKNLIADAIGTAQRTYYDQIAQDTVATIVNDMATVGAQPLAISPIWNMGSSEWFENRNRWRDLVNGWAKACKEVGAVYAAGETAVLPQMLYPDVAVLSGSGNGIISPKERLTLGDKLEVGDHIVVIESSGIHANGLSLARKIATEYLPEGYNTKLANGLTFGEALLNPTHLYSPLQNELFNMGVDIHYMVHVTGHGLRKLMRADREFTYRMHTVPWPQEEFLLMQQAGDITDEDMYATFNMGIGFAFFVPPHDAQKTREIAGKYNLAAWDGGTVEEGSKQVIIEPKKIVYPAETLQIR